MANSYIYKNVRNTGEADHTCAVNSDRTKFHRNPKPTAAPIFRAQRILIN